MSSERLQKVMAAAGVASRRACEKIIEDGRVTVDGHVITTLGTKVDPEQVEIAVDGESLRLGGRDVYIKLHKPRGILSDIGGDTRGRKTVADLLPSTIRRVFTVGRLDLNSEGLVLLTNDGELAHRLTHPRFEHRKTYFVLVDKLPKPADLHRLRQGIDIGEVRTAPAEVERITSLPASLHLDEGPNNGVWLKFVLREGKKRQIRHMVAAVGLSTRRLVRSAIGPLRLGNVKPAEWRYLTKEEITSLHDVTSQASSGRSRKRLGPAGQRRPQRAAGLRRKGTRKGRK